MADDIEELVKEGKKLLDENPPLKTAFEADRAKEKRVVHYDRLRKTIPDVYGTPNISTDQILHGLYTLSRAYNRPVELDSDSCRAAGVDWESLRDRLRFRLRQRGRQDEADALFNAYRFEETAGDRSAKSRRDRLAKRLQAEMGCLSRCELAKRLRIDPSALRGIIRGDYTHGGRGAEAELLALFQQHRIDFSDW